jgi:FkbM family methyltransferase
LSFSATLVPTAPAINYHLKRQFFNKKVEDRPFIFRLTCDKKCTMNTRALGNLFSGPSFQPMWKRLHKLSLHRMNYGRGATVAGSGEEWVLGYLKRANRHRTPFVVFDVGANTGRYTEMALSSLGKHTKVYCFEPNEATFSVLKSNHGTNESVRCYNIGLSDKEESLVLYSNGETSGMASLYLRHLDHAHIIMKPISRVSLTTLDLFCKREKVERIDFLKMDVEGHELKVLKGAAEMISSGGIASMQFEFGDCNVDSRTFFRDFFEFLTPHYKVFRILHQGLWPIDNYDEAYEIFKVTNYFAIRRGTDQIT